MTATNQERVGKALDLLKIGLAAYVDRQFTSMYGDERLDEAQRFLYGDRLDTSREISRWDVAALLNLMWESWNDVFRRNLAPSERTLVSELRGFRNKWAHQESFTTDDAYRALDSASRLLAAIGASGTDDIEKMKLDLMRVRLDEHARDEVPQLTDAVGGQGSSGPAQGTVAPSLPAHVADAHSPAAAELYRGVWPQVVSKLAKYAVRFVDGGWRVTVLYEAGTGLRYLAVEGAQEELVHRVNSIKRSMRDELGGAFYVNEYRHVVVPVRDETGSGVGAWYYSAGRLESDLAFEFEGHLLTTRPVDVDGRPLRPGDSWVGPRPGIPYKLKAGAGDIEFRTPALTETEPVRVRTRVTRHVRLSKVLADPEAVLRAVSPISNVRGYRGGRFYVNEHGALFTPVTADDGNGIDYIYCGQLDMAAWFPEPSIPS